MAIRMKTMVTLKAAAICTSHSRSDISVRDVTFTIDEPAARGGTNMGPSPTETALAGCVNVIGHKCASALGVDIGQLKIDAECQFDRRGVILESEIDVPFKSVAVTVRANGSADQAALTRVGVETEKYCPLSKLFRSAGTEVEVTWVKNQALR